jgi:acyl carrier protein/3-hydroxymyristoyl/3-hydroxydecanoyl-(acyl carrier protein) dehydratase
VPRPYHTPLLDDAKQPFQQAIDQNSIQAPQQRFISSVSLEYVTCAEAVRQNLVEQLTTPVRYVQLIQRLADDGVSVFVEVGPQQVLTRLNQRILAGRAASTVASDLPKHPAREGLQRVVALMEAAGVKQAVAAPTGHSLEAATQRILFFDATQRRRGKLGNGSAEHRNGNGHHGNGHHESVDAAAAHTELIVASAPVVQVDKDAVQTFMIRFVVDQTGYPEDMVELDADLEADLGIDSIKKAQLIGELAENFELKHLAGQLQNLSLDDFRTIRSILEFVTSPVPVTEVGREAASVVEAEPKAIEAAQVTEMAIVEAPTELITVQVDKDAVQSFMIRFVVDQTGYPEDMVELDADLEADLGIDSIKKAQLIGELAENFELKHLAGQLQNLSLDDFRTIRSILEFVTSPVSVAAAEPASVSVVEPRVIDSPALVHQPVMGDDGAAALPDAFSVVTLSGSPFEIGLQHGRSQGVEIRSILERYTAMLGPRLQNMPELDEALTRPTMYFGEEEIEELHGIAQGCELPVPAVIAHNLGMYPDYVPGCTQFALTRRRNPQFGMVHAVNEDSPLSLTLTDCLARIVQVRQPVGGIPHVTFSVAGQTGGLNGINAAGLAISSTLLLDRPRRPATAVGKVHPVIVKRLLQQAETIEDAIKLLRTLDRAGAWSLCLSHFPTDRLCYLEYDGSTLQVQDNPETVFTTNHCLLQPPLADVPEHSRHRLARLEQLLSAGEPSGVSLEQAQKALRDQFDRGRGRQTAHATMNTIRRVDNQISIVMRPETGELYATPGPRSGGIVDRYFRLEVKNLWSDVKPTEAHGSHPAASDRIILPKREAGPSESPGFKAAVNPREGLPAEATRAVQRHVLRMSEAPLSGAAPALKFAGAVLVLGQNKLTDALRTQLQAAGATVHVLTGDADAAVAELDKLWKQQPAPHLFVTTAREDAAAVTAEAWNARQPAGVLTPFFVCQRWMQLVSESKVTASATLVGVTAMGGDFGFSGRIHGVEGGGITGLFKGIRREFPGLCVKVIDAPLEESAEGLAKSVLAELAHRDAKLEVGYVRGERSVVRAVPQPASTQRRGRRTPQGAWVITGGARGVTAVVARELGRRFGLKLHLLGSTPQPNIDPSWRNLTDAGLKSLKRTISDQARETGKTPAAAWKEVERALEIDRSLQAFRAEGVAATYHACDVSDRAALAATLKRIRQQDGPIRGVIHGAGLESACRFDKKKRDSVRATLAVKVDAAMALVELTDADPVDYFVGFGSTSGRFGGMGQTDYSMASDLLCKLCDWLRARKPQIAAVGMHWPPWADVGMAARPESKIALQSSNLTFMPPLEGAAHVIDELLGLGDEGELLFLDKPDGIDTDGTMPASAEKETYLRRNDLVRSSAIINTIHEVREGASLLASAEFDPTVEPFLLEHRHHGVPILPAVVGMEAMAEAASILSADGRKVVAVTRMNIHQGLRFHTDRSQRARIVVNASVTSEGIHAELQADFCDRQGRLVEAHRRQMDAIIELARDYTPLPKVDLGPAPTNWIGHQYVADWRTMKFPEEARVYHGNCFRALKDYALVDDGIWARLIVPSPSLIAGDRPAAGWLLPSAVFDAGLLGIDLCVWNTRRIASLPHSFKQIRFARPLREGEPLRLRIWTGELKGRFLSSDFVMVDLAGNVVVHARGIELVEVKTGMTNVPATAAPATEASSAPTPVSKPTVPVAPAPATVVGPAPGPAPAPMKKDHAANGRSGDALPAPAPAPAPIRRASQPTTAQSAAPQTVDVSDLPLIDAACWVDAEHLTAELRFDPQTDLFLQQHRFSGKPLLPAVIGMEAMIEAASLALPGKPLQRVRDFHICGPMKFRDDAPQSAKVEVSLVGGAAECRLIGLSEKEVVLQTATIEFGPRAEPLTAPPPGPPPLMYSPMQYADEKQAQLVHGPLFRGLKALCLQRESGWGKVTGLPANNLAGARQGRWFLPAAVLDSCLVACGVDLFILMAKRVEIPQGIDEVLLQRLPEPNEACVMRLYFRGSDEKHTRYDLTLYGAKNDVVLMVKGYRGIRTSKDADASLWDNSEFAPQPT